MPSIAGSLQSRITVFFVLLMLFVQVGGLVLINSAGQANARTTTREGLVRGERIFHHLFEENAAQLAQGARILAADYAFREALSSHDQETIVSALANHGARIHAQVMTLVGLDRHVIADTLETGRVGKPFPIDALIDATNRSGIASSLAVLDGKLYQVVVVPVTAPITVAWVAIGFAVDDDYAANLLRLTGLDISFASRRGHDAWTLQASTLGAALRPTLQDAMREPDFMTSGVRTMAAAGDEFETLITEPQAAGDQSIVTLLQTSLDRAVAEFDRLRQRLLVVSLIGLVVSIVGSVALARGISRPVRQLAVFARLIASGTYSEPPRIRCNDEIGDLSSAFDHMRESIGSREMKIMQLAYRDTLTGLPNRALFNDRLQQAIGTARRVQAPLSVLIMDLDHFKLVNDTLGHAVGDRLLCVVATLLSDVLQREADTVARLGGDEFAVLLPTDDVAGAQLIAGRIVRALEAPIDIDGRFVDVHGSIGIASFPEHGDDLETLVRRADVAMYLAKRNGTGFAIYDPRYDQHTAERLSMMGELRKAVEENELVLHYQPKVSLDGAGRPRLHAVEALVRWRHPTRGFVPPMDFIPFAEQTGYIRAITLWVMDEAIAQCARWRREGLHVDVSINISARDLMNAELPTRFAAMLERHGCEAGSFWLEITESAILEDAGRALENLDRLHALGCKLSIDDYGTGYSSLSYLKKLPVDELKIDRSFIVGMMGDPDDVVIVRSTIDLAHNLRLKVTAEGVEDLATLERLRELGCDMVQGFLMSRPVPAAEAAAWMRDSPWSAPWSAPLLGPSSRPAIRRVG